MYGTQEPVLIELFLDLSQLFSPTLYAAQIINPIISSTRTELANLPNGVYVTTKRDNITDISTAITLLFPVNFPCLSFKNGRSLKIIYIAMKKTIIG